MPKVLLGWKPIPEELAFIKEFWPESVEVINPETYTPAGLDSLLPDVDVVVGSAVTNERLLKCTGVKLVQTLEHGVDRFMQPAVRNFLLERGTLLAKANPASINIAEFVMMSMIALSRRVFKMHEALVYQGSWSDSRKAGRMQGSLGGELYGSVLGLIGFGAIGQEVARRASAFGMQVGTLVRNPHRVDTEKHALAFVSTPAELDAFLSRCDYVVLNLPLTPDNRDMMNHDRFQAMKTGSYFINISRGGLVDEQALYQALHTGKLAGVASDVWRVEEEPGPKGYPTPYPMHHYNVIMTPHYCGATYESRRRAIRTAGENIGRWLRGEPLVNVADLTVGF